MCLINFDMMVAVMSYLLADVIAIYLVVDGKPQRQMLLPLFYPNGRCYCHSFMWHVVGHYIACYSI